MASSSDSAALAEAAPAQDVPETQQQASGSESEEDGSDDEDYGLSETDDSDGESGSDGSGAGGRSADDSGQQQGATPSPQAAREKKPCRYYNEGHCTKGKKCPYLHICKYYLKGGCRNGSQCDLKHAAASRSESSSDEGAERDSDRPYRWQISSGERWLDITNDHVIEAQYSLPSVRGIKLYNTIFGVVAIDFTKMRVLKKKLKVRRKSPDGAVQDATSWLWYCHGKQGWTLYGEKGPKGKSAPVKSSRIEKEFQKKPGRSFTFTCGQTKYEIDFREMKQVNMATGHKRRIVRRPQFILPPKKGKKNKSLESSLQQLRVSPRSTTPVWQFEGDSGRWYNFKHRSGTNSECSVSSADIEAQFQRNQVGSMNFQAGGFQYSLNFSDMTQTNLTSTKKRRIRRSLM
ncbi:protein mono-ADP-ribosyltransferase PARP12-like [Lepisosteus oculatus]|uniref:protein mono-ADP-ribosyltransferase PARP12-like n=1 Tax=Lepisosteus oculatus TaxID=7918 RepID=UPI00371A288F